MKNKIKLLTILGARPQLIKAAAFSRLIKGTEDSDNITLEEDILYTGQHYDHNMSQVFFDQLDIPRPKYNLGIKAFQHGEMTGLMLQAIEPVIIEEKPDYVLVYGDTNSTIAGALAAAKLQIPVVHVEAGLRSYNRSVPEEINRIITDHISELLFCPTENAVVNLKKEGIEKGVYNVGDIMLDAFVASKALSGNRSNILAKLELSRKQYCMATVHRQENTNNPARLQDIFSAFDAVANPGNVLVVPLHPRTRKAIKTIGISTLGNPSIKYIAPLNYLDSITLLSNAKVLFTDSGGMQKEAFFASVPCITLRDETEWIETVDLGWNNLVGTDFKQITKTYDRLKEMVLKEAPAVYGEGTTSQHILELLANDYKQRYDNI